MRWGLNLSLSRVRKNDLGNEMIMGYRHTQTGFTILAFFALAIIVILALTPDKASFIYTLLPIGILLIFSGLFCSMTVQIGNGTLFWFFGPRFWKKKIQLTEVEHAEIVTNSWWYGWGIRLTNSGWLYNVSGLKAVQISTKNGKKIRLGTNDPVGLLNAITDNIT